MSRVNKIRILTGAAMIMAAFYGGSAADHFFPMWLALPSVFSAYLTGVGGFACITWGVTNHQDSKKP